MQISKLPKEIKDLLISVYQIGYWDRDAKLALFNNLVTNEEPILYLEAVLENEKQEEIDLELIDSVS
jgi:hypothetical protein